MRFIIFVIDRQSGSASGSESADIDAFNDHLRANGHWVMAAGIGAPATATVVEDGVIRRGSLFDGDRFYSGFWVIEADDQKTALDLAVAGSRACNRSVELRPFLR